MREHPLCTKLIVRGIYFPPAWVRRGSRLRVSTEDENMGWPRGTVPEWLGMGRAGVVWHFLILLHLGGEGGELGQRMEVVTCPYWGVIAEE